MKTLALVLLASLASAQEISKPRLTVLDNGLRVITVEDHKDPLISAVWSAHVGDSAEPADFSGNSHFLEHLLLMRGTEKYPGGRLLDMIGTAGGYLNGHTWFDYTTFEILLPSARLDDILDMHEQMMFHAAFDAKGFELEKNAVFEELRTGEDKPMLHLERSAPYHMYDGETYYSRSTIGTIEKVKGATADRVRRYYRDYYVPNNMTLVLVGDFDTAAAVAKVRARFERYPSRKLPEDPYRVQDIRPGATVRVEERAVGKAYMLAAFPAPEARSPDFAAFQVLMSYLADGQTAPLHESLVERQKLLGSIDGEAWPHRRPGGWIPFLLEGDPRTAADGVAGLFAELTKVRLSGVPAESLELAKSRLLNRSRVDAEDLYRRATALAKADAYGDFRIEAESTDRISRVTPEDAWAVAKKYFDPSRLFVMAAFPTGKAPADFADRVRAAAAKESAASGGLDSSTLPSGATLIHDPRPGAPVESFTAAVRAGARLDGERPGTASAVAAMLVRRTANRTKARLQDALDSAGITLTGYARNDAAYFTATVPAGRMTTAAALLREILAEPSFAAEDLNEVRRNMISGIVSEMDRPDSVAYDQLLEEIYPGTPYGGSLARLKAGLEALDLATLKLFYDRYYRADRIAISYSGPASKAAVADALAGPLPAAKDAGAEPSFAASVPEKILTDRTVMADKKQAQLAWGWPAPPLTSDDYILWTLAERTMGGDTAGRLWQLRQKEGLAYSVWMYGTPFKDRPLTVLTMAMDRAKYPAAVAALHREIERARAGLTAEELARVKVSHLATLDIQDSKAESRARRHASWWVWGVGADYRARLRRVIAGATLDEVNRVVRETLRADRFYKAEAGAFDAPSVK